MGWEAGLLGGFLGRKGEVEAENLRASELASQRESDVYKLLLGSDNPELQAMAMAGLLEGTQQKKRKGGLKGWVGEMEGSPTFSRLMSFMGTPQPVMEERMTLPSRSLNDMRATGMPEDLPGQMVQPMATDVPAGAPAAGAPTSPVQPGMGGPPKPMAYSTAPPQPYMMQAGTALPQIFLTPEQRMRRDVRLKAEGEGLEITERQKAFYNAARPYMPHDKAMEWSLEQIGHRPTATGGASGMRFGGVLKGDMVPQGQLDTFGQPVRPDQWYRTQIQPNGAGLMYVPTVAPSGPSAGVEYNRAAIQMGYARPADVPAEKRVELEANAEKLASELREATGLGAGRAAIETELNMPIGATAAIQYGVPPTTTLKQLSETIGLSAEQKQRVYTLGQVDVLIADIDRLIPQVFPNVPEGIGGRIKSQLSLGFQKLAADADLAALDASINGALAQIAQLSGQPGSRLSDKDIEIARGQLSTLTPSMFGGDTINTAKARMNIVKALLEKARGSIGSPTLTAPPRPGGAANPAGGPAGAVVRDGILYINGQAVGDVGN